MLIRYCATHLGYVGYPRVLGVRWNGWTISSVGGLCEACRERERDRWETAPYGQVLIPAPVELGPRTLVRRVTAATLAATAVAVVTTAALLVVQPPDLIPSGGEPGHFSSGARLAGSPASAEASTETEEPAASRRARRAPALSRVVASRAAHPGTSMAAVATPVRLGNACSAPRVPRTPAAVAPAPGAVVAIATQAP